MIEEIIIKTGIWSLVVGVVLGFLVKKLNAWINTLNEQAKEQVRQIKNEEIQKVIKSLKIAAEKYFNSTEGTKKKVWVIKSIKQFIPDIIISDTQVEVLIESIYRQINSDLKEWENK